MVTVKAVIYFKFTPWKFDLRKFRKSKYIFKDIMLNSTVGVVGVGQRGHGLVVLLKVVISKVAAA